MVNYGFILLPLYVSPETSGAWDPLINIAKSTPNVNFTAIVNPNNGPGGSACPTPAYVQSIAQLNAIPNIDVIGYVHTANSYTCNTICTCSQPLEAIEANITTYQNWPANCPNNIHVNGVFIDEAPSDPSCLSYMQNATSFAKSTLTNGNTVFFNPGSSVDSRYFGIADFINVFENSEAVYDSANIGSLDGNGMYSRNSTLLIYNYTTGTGTLQQDVSTILGFQHDSIAGLYITDLSGYTQFPTIWNTFVGDVSTVVASNKAV